MRIHILRAGEDTASIAKKYGINENNLIFANELENTTPTVGEELLILTPTRTHRVIYGDTLERLALRYGVSVREIIKMNPWISEKGLVPNSVVGVRSGEKAYGTAVTNGYYYSECTKKQLERALPYLTYVTFGSAVIDGGSARWIFDAKDAVNRVTEAEKIPLLRVFERDCTKKFESDEYQKRYIETLISLAKSQGYRGIVFGGSGQPGYALSSFLIEMKKNIIGSDLILFTEVTPESDVKLTECADGSIFSYSKLEDEVTPSFSEGERHAFEKYATEADSIKSFADIISLAKIDSGFCDLRDALSLARKLGVEITRDDSTLLSSFSHPKIGKCTYQSLEYMKAILALLLEYGFMGISFDIMRTPISYLLMYNDMFGTAYHTTAKSREGCSRALAR